MTTRRQAAYRLACDAVAVLRPEEWLRFYNAALDASRAAEPPLERPCACGGTVRRRNPQGRWPARCETCKEAAA
jgi:hypothetical protein